MQKDNTYKFSLWGLLGILGYLGFREFYFINVMAYVGSQNVWDSRRFIAFLAVSILAGIAWLGTGLNWLTWRKSLRLDSLRKLPKAIRWAAAILLVSLPGMLKWILPLPANFTLGYWMELLLIYCTALMAAWLVMSKDASNLSKLLANAAFIMAAGVGHSILLKLCQVTDYPFTLFWSEGNRFFDYSTLLGSSRYILPEGESISAFISWGMQLPFALPFLSSNLNIGAFRLWYQLVWIIPALALGVMAAWKKPVSGKQGILLLVFAGWTFLFLDQGPIYPPLILAAMLTILAVRAKLPLGIILIMAASFYARRSRWTWCYSPGLWAGMLALLEIRKPDLSKDGWKQLIKPAALGVSGYVGGQILPPLIRNLSASTLKFLPDVVTSTTRQPLLWDRLFPNPTFGPGILYGLLWASLPLIVLLAALLVKRAWKINWPQGLGVLAVAGAFLTVGIIASVKIGGGSNLHNLDNFLLTLVMILTAALAYVNRENLDIRKQPLLVVLVCIALVAPVTYTLQGGARLSLPAEETSRETLEAVQTTVEKYTAQGEVLFIDQRQLLTFGMIEDVPLVDDYEKKYLMDQAMADNSDYFEDFYHDLQAKRFVLIVNEPSNYIIRGSEHSFGEENDAYVKWVTIPLLCTYEPIYTSREVGVELLVPKQTPLDDPVCEDYLN